MDSDKGGSFLRYSVVFYSWSIIAIRLYCTVIEIWSFQDLGSRP